MDNNTRVTAAERTAAQDLIDHARTRLALDIPETELRATDGPTTDAMDILFAAVRHVDRIVPTMTINIQYESIRSAEVGARELATRNGSPVAIWKRDGWYGLCEDAPEYDEQDVDGWQLHSFVAPELEDDTPPRKLTRNEQIEALADSGCDTWEDYRGER